MKKLLYLTLFLACPLLAIAQKKFAAIDARAKSIGYLPLQELTKKLTASYSNEEDKVRSIFTWIAYHISYDWKEFEQEDSLRYDKHKYSFVKEQAAFDSLWNYEYAAFVLRNHRGICSEYAALFKVMCEIAHLKCEIVAGYAKWSKQIGNPYESNHAWNAVLINDKWQLMDVTWASGAIDRKHGKSNYEINYFYYCTPPELLINNHYPDKIKWTLLDKITSRAEFEKAIYFNYEDQNKIRIDSTVPKIGFLKKKVGDSISFEIVTSAKVNLIDLTLNDTVEDISYFPIPDTTTNSDKKVPHSTTVNEVTSKEDGMIDGLINYLDTVKNTSDNEIPVLNLTLVMQTTDVQHFKRGGNKVYFEYYIKKKGDFLIWIYINYEPVMAYRLLAD